MFRFSPRRNRADQVKWREWGGDAFREAAQRDKPVALFITAFWCGFCQRMDETTLSSEDVITVLNSLFVPVRVEESQRPDVDIRYNQNGWPTIVFLTPQGDQLHTVNYLAPQPFLDVLAQVVTFYEQNKAALATASAQTAPPPARGEEPPPLSMEIVGEIAGMIEGLADREYGGFGNGFKFFHPEANEFLLYLYEITGDRAYLDHVLFTLDRMRESRTFDASEGGFFRYSSKRDWQEPHPEKMLGDQAGLLSLYLHAWLLAERESDRATAEGLVDYLNRTLFDETRGVFFGCQDYVRTPTGSRAPGAPATEMRSLIDEYVYGDANARAASAYLAAWRLLGREDCRARAVAALEWLWQRLRAPDGGMYHYAAGSEAQVPGLLADTVLMGAACLDADALLGDGVYLDRARQLADAIIRTHQNPAGGFYDIAEAGPAALRFPLTPLAENAAAARLLTRLADVSGQPAYREWAAFALQTFPNAHRRYGAYAAGFGHALALLLAAPVTLELTGTSGDPQTRALLRAAATQLRYQNPVLRWNAGRNGGAPALAVSAGGRSTGPITDPAAVLPQTVVERLRKYRPTP